MRHLGNTVGVPEDDTDLGGGQTLLGKLEDLVLHLVAGDLEPLGNRPEGTHSCPAAQPPQGSEYVSCSPPVGKCRLADALSRCVHATHPAFLRPSL